MKLRRLLSAALAAGLVLGVSATAGASRSAGGPTLRVPHGSFGALDSSLGRIWELQKTKGTTAALSAAAAAGLEVEQRRVKVIVTARPRQVSAVRSAIAASGGVVDRTVAELVQAFIPPAALSRLAGDDAVATVSEPPFAEAQTVVDEAVVATNANSLHTSGTDGTGVKVAIIDLGFQGLDLAFGTPMPSWITTLNFGCTGGAGEASGVTSHGTAVAEIVHQMAPGAQLELMCIDTVLDLQSAEQQAVTDGVKVINHSVGWFGTSRGDGSGGPGMPDAIVADARREGILWVNAAGNEAGTHWSGTFQPGPGENSDLNDFGFGNVLNTFTIGADETACIVLTWDGWPITSEDYDWGLFDLSGPATLVRSSTNDQASAPAAPVEGDCYTNPTHGDRAYGVAIARYHAVGSPRLDLYVLNSKSNLQFATESGSLVEPASSPAALAVGAVCWQNQQLEPFSSRGPTIDGRSKPDLLGPDSVSTATYGPFSGCTFTGFRGTSAAAPHVAGAAALLAQAHPGATPAELETQLLAQVARSADRGGAALALPLSLHPPFAGGPIAYSSRSQIGIANADGSNETQLTSDAGNGASAPAISPDGTKIAFSSSQDGDPEIYVMNLDGTGRTQLTANTIDDTDPAWSPDGTQLAFVRNSEIYRMNASGLGSPTQLTNDTVPDWNPDWSVTGKIAFTAEYSPAPGFIRWDIFSMNAADGSSMTNLTNGAVSGANYDPSWSPDGSKIAFIAGNGLAPLYVMNADGSNPTLVTNGAAATAWTPDPARLLFATGSFSSEGDLYSVAVDGTKLARLTTTPFPYDEARPSVRGPAIKAFTAGVPVVTGAPRVGQPLAAVQPAWIGTNPYTTTYQWQRCSPICQDIPGALESFYTPTPADVGSPLRATVTAHDAAGDTQVPSALSDVVLSLAPTIAQLPTITGPAQQGQTLSVVSIGGWNNGPTSAGLQWERCDVDGAGCVNIGGATGAGYVLTGADVTHTIRLAVTAQNAAGPGYSASLQSAVVAAAPSSGGGGGGGGGAGGVPPDLHVELTSNAATVPPVGSEVLYFVTVSTKNVGASSETRLDLTLPAGYTVTRSYADRGPGCTGIAPTLTCNVAFISPGVNTNVTIWGTVGQAGELVATATVTGLVETELAATLADNTVTLKISPPVQSGGGGGNTGGGNQIVTPSAVRAPALSGKPTTGSILRAVPATWSQKPTRVSYQWQLCATACVAIKNANSPTLKLLKRYAGKSVRVVVTARFPGATVKSASKKVAVKKGKF
jgi:hypothetical protein